MQIIRCRACKLHARPQCRMQGFGLQSEMHGTQSGVVRAGGASVAHLLFKVQRVGVHTHDLLNTNRMRYCKLLTIFLPHSGACLITQFKGAGPVYGVERI